jgi:hypothetical protein
MLRFAAVDSKSMLEKNRVGRISQSRNFSRLRLLFLAGTVAAASLTGSTFALSGCAANLEEPDKYDIVINGETTGLPCDWNKLMTKSCWGIGCHGSDTPAAMLDLQTAGAESRVLDVAASHADILDGSDVNCMAGELRVDSANPENSLMLKKVEGRHTCGSKMPVSPRMVDANDIACIRAWVYRAAGKDPSMAPSSGGSGGMTTAGTGGGGAGGMSSGGTGGGGAGGMSGGGTGGGGTGGGGTGGTGGSSGGGTGGAGGTGGSGGTGGT